LCRQVLASQGQKQKATQRHGTTRNDVSDSAPRRLIMNGDPLILKQHDCLRPFAINLTMKWQQRDDYTPNFTRVAEGGRDTIAPFATVAGVVTTAKDCRRS
jgi:hypothetical protein